MMIIMNDKEEYDFYRLPKGTLKAKKPAGCKVVGNITLTSKNPSFSVRVGKLDCGPSSKGGKKR